MAQKLFKAGGRRKVAAKRPAKKTEDGSVVLVGTYHEKQLDWIKRNGVYNYPVKDENGGRARTPTAPQEGNLVKFASKVKELWLYAGAKAKRHCFAAEFVGIQSKAEFLAANPTYAKKVGKPSHAQYAVFRTKPFDYGPKLEGKVVVACAIDFMTGRGQTKKVAAAIRQFHADGEFAPLAAYLPKELGEVPRPQLRVCEAAVRLDFVFLYPGRVEKTQSSESEDLKVISLFSGAGGLDIGFNHAGFKTSVMVEMDPACCRTLRKNMPETPVIEGDINNISTDQILNAGGLKPLEAALVIGGPPCQSFSLAGKRMGMDDPRGMLVLQFIRVVREALPKAFVMENVRGMTNWEKGKAIDAIMHEATLPIFYKGKAYSYRVKYQILNAADFGAPQFRERVFIVGNRLEKNFAFPVKRFGPSGNAEGLKPYVTVRDAICGLPPATPPSEVALRVSGTIKGRIEKHGY